MVINTSLHLACNISGESGSYEREERDLKKREENTEQFWILAKTNIKSVFHYLNKIVTQRDVDKL